MAVNRGVGTPGGKRDVFLLFVSEKTCKWPTFVSSISRDLRTPERGGMTRRPGQGRAGVGRQRPLGQGSQEKTNPLRDIGFYV